MWSWIPQGSCSSWFFPTPSSCPSVALPPAHVLSLKVVLFSLHCVDPESNSASFSDIRQTTCTIYLSLSMLWSDQERFYHSNANILKLHVRHLESTWLLSSSTSHLQNPQNKVCSSHCSPLWLLSHAKLVPASGPLHLLDEHYSGDGYSKSPDLTTTQSMHVTKLCLYPLNLHINK